MATVLLQGCVVTPPVATPEAVEPAPAAQAEPEAKVVPLDEELIYDFLLADIASRRGFVDESMQAILRMAERTRDVPLVARSFRQALRMGDGELAERMALLLREIDDSIQSAFALAQAYMLQERQEDALQLLEQMLIDWPDARDRLFNSIAEMFAGRKDAADFLPRLEALANQYPDERHGYYALSYLANRANNAEVFDRAITRTLELDPQWEQAALVKFVRLVRNADADRVQAFADSFLEGNSSAWQLMERYARYLAGLQEMQKSYQVFARLVRGQPQNSEALLAAALVSMELKKNSRARRLFMKHLEMNPANDQTRMYLGQVAARRKMWREAIDWYLSIHDDNLYFEAQIRVSSALLETDGGDAALEHLYELIPASLNEEVRLYLAQESVLREMDRLDDAWKLLGAAVQEVPDNSELLYARGLLAAELHYLEEHEADIRRVLELEPENAHAYNALGYTLADQTNRYQEALELISRALDLAPNDPFILDSMGWVQFRLGDLDKAESFLRRALDIRKDAEIAAHLGEVLWVSGRQPEANEVWQGGLKVDPDNRTLKKTLERLRQ